MASWLIVLVVLAASVAFAYLGTETQTPTPDCQGLPVPELADCLADWGVGNIDDLPRVIDTLTKYTVSDQEFGASPCHDTWHKVGEAAGLKYDARDSLSEWPYSCAGGFMHGLMWTYAPKVGPEGFKSAAAGLCALFKNRPEVVYLDCWHGIGHGLAEVYAFPESMYQCGSVAMTTEEYEWCTWGAADTLSDDFIKDQKMQQELGPGLPELCPGLEQATKACFRVVASMLYNYGWTFSDLYKYCSTLKTGLRSECAFSAGQILGMLWVSGREPASKCSLHKDLARECASGAGKYVGRVIEWDAITSEAVGPEKMLGICPEFDPELRLSCETAYKAVRELELSPKENLEVTLSW